MASGDYKTDLNISDDIEAVVHTLNNYKPSETYDSDTSKTHECELDNDAANQPYELQAEDNSIGDGAIQALHRTETKAAETKGMKICERQLSEINNFDQNQENCEDNEVLIQPERWCVHSTEDLSFSSQQEDVVAYSKLLIIDDIEALVNVSDNENQSETYGGETSITHQFELDNDAANQPYKSQADDNLIGDGAVQELHCTETLSAEYKGMDICERHFSEIGKLDQDQENCEDNEVLTQPERWCVHSTEKFLFSSQQEDVIAKNTQEENDSMVYPSCSLETLSNMDTDNKYIKMKACPGDTAEELANKYIYNFKVSRKRFVSRVADALNNRGLGYRESQMLKEGSDYEGMLIKAQQSDHQIDQLQINAEENGSVSNPSSFANIQSEAIHTNDVFINTDNTVDDLLPRLSTIFQTFRVKWRSNVFEIINHYKRSLESRPIIANKPKEQQPQSDELQHNQCITNDLQSDNINFQNNTVLDENFGTYNQDVSPAEETVLEIVESLINQLQLEENYCSSCHCCDQST